jgi:uncharacterized repeat protein (TIGR03803 family)
VAFELTPDQSGGTYTFHLIHEFPDTLVTDPTWPTALVADAAGNLFGALTTGDSPTSSGTVFMLSPSGGGSFWNYSVLTELTSYADGVEPSDWMAVNAAGTAVYFSTVSGGNSGCGFLYRLSPSGLNGPWTRTPLHAFGANFGQPTADACAASGLELTGNVIYGATQLGGGNGCPPGVGGGCGAIYSYTVPP